MNTENLVMLTLIAVFFLVFLILLKLQIYLSMKKFKFLGLIIPILYFIFGIYLTLSISENGGKSIFIINLYFLPAIANLVTYFVCRSMLKEK